MTVVATDSSGNQQRCYFQVSVQPTQCVDWELKAINCLPPSNRPAESGGLECVATCNPGFRFTDGEPVKTFRCDVKQPWTPSHVVPDCVTEETQQAAYNVVGQSPLQGGHSVRPGHFSPAISHNTPLLSGRSTRRWTAARPSAST